MRCGTRLSLWILPFPLLLVVVAVGKAALYSYTTEELSGPEQPIEFNHQVHFESLKIECLYCHGAAEKSRRAGIPAVSVCMGCHQNMADTTFWTEEVIAKYGRILTDDEHIEHMNHLILEAVYAG